MGRSISLAFCVVLLFSVLGKPANADDKCSLGCKGGSQTTTFLNGHKYNYGVEGTVSIYLSGAENKETSVKLLGQVTVTSVGNCVNELTVQNLAISGPDGKKYASPPGIEKPILFTLEDGKTGSEICAEEGDTRRSLNIKRAIVSLLQTEQKSATQTDVFGACPTEASSSKEGGAVLVHRSRDLSRCAHREQGKNDMVSAVYNPTAEIKSTQVLQSILNVESKVNNGVPEKVAANEEYLYKPFSVGENGARAKVHTKLTLTGKAAGAAAPNQCTVTRTIIFENPHGEHSDKSNINAVLSVVKETAKAVNSEASFKSAGLFAQAIRIFRTASKDDLLKAYTQLKNSKVEKRVFLDALFRTGTGASVEASVTILKQGQLNNIEEEVFYLTLAGARHVHNDAVKAAASLIDRPHNKKVYIGLGALAGVYCREHDCHTGKSTGVAELSQKLGAKLNCRSKDKAAEDEAVFILKGIRNIRHLENSLIEKVIRCANDAGVKPRVRVAALEAYLADPCSAKLKKSALDLLKNQQLDSEIRIKAYLAVIGCPCGQSANEIRKLLDHEPVHQVGRFITTSLRHIKASTNPDKKLARLHYGLIRPPNKFNVDDRKYSFYREASFNIDTLGLGGNVEQTVIYSQDSFLPRSANVNLTAELFGHSLNVLEVGGRQGNLDRVAEHLYGPRSLFRTKNPQEVVDEIKKTYYDTKKETDAHLSRGRRSAKTEVDNFDKHLKEEAEPYNNELELDVYLKLFGTDALYLSFGDDQSFDFHQFIQKQLKLGDTVLDKLKNFQYELRSHLLFLDAQLAYPTSTGFPLKLDLVGSTTARVDIGANVDVRQILKSPQNAKVDVKLVPSSDVEIAGIFLVDADAVATGLKVVTNLHSSTGVHIIAKVLENGNGFDLQLGLPIDKQEILTASHDLVYFTTEKGQLEKHVAVKTNADKKDYSGCFDQLSNLLGLTLCGELSIPFSVSGPEAQASVSNFLTRYPLAGGSKVRLMLENNDLQGYHIKGVYRVQNGDRRQLELLFEAEGSKKRRTQLIGEYVNNQQEKSVKLSLDSPIKVLSGELSLYTKPSEYALLVKGTVDKAIYYAKAGFSVQGDDRRSVFRPVVEYELPEANGKQSLKIDGEVLREVNAPVTKYTLQGVKVHLPNAKDVVDINGHFSQAPNSLDLDLKAKQGEYNLLLSGSLKGHDVKIELQNNLNAMVNFKLGGHFEYGETIRNEFDLTYGPDLRDQNSRIVFNQLLKYHVESADKYNIITKNKFEVLALPLKIKADAEADPKKLDIDIEGQYIDKKGEFELESRTQVKKPGDYVIKVSAGFDKQGVEAFAKRDIVNQDKSNFENYIQVKNVGKYELSGVVLHKNKPNDKNIGANGHLKVTAQGKNEDIKFDVGLIENNKLYSSHAKISYSQGDFLDYLLKITRGANPTGQLKLILKDTISANGQFKVTDSDGKGNGMVIVDFKKAQRKLKGDVKFIIKDPVYNADVDVYLNFEKDNKDKIHFSTNTKRTANLVDSKNKLEYADKKSEVNVHAEGSLEGKSHANVEVILPTERVLTLKVDRDMTLKDNVVNGHAEVVLSDAEKRGAAASKLTYKGKVVDSNVEKGFYHYEGQVDLQLKNGKQLQKNFLLKNNPKGDKLNFYFKGDVGGNLIPKPASVLANVVYDETNTLLYDSDVQLKGNYGDDYAFEVTELTKVEKNKFVDDVVFTVRLPFEKAHDLKFVSNVLFLEHENKEFTEYTIVEYVQVNADLYKVDASGKFGVKEGYGKAKVIVPHTDPFIFETNYKTDLEGDKKTANVELKSQYGKGKTASVALEAGASPHQEYNLKIKANAPQNEKLKKLELSVVTKTPTPDSVSAVVIGEADGRVYKSESLIVYSKANPVLDVKYTSPSTPKPSRVYLKGTSLSSSQGKLELKIENIRGISLDAVSEGNVQKDNVAFKFQANSEELGFKNYKVDISSKDAGSGKRLEFHAVNDGKNVLSGSTSFISKQEGTKTIIEGSGSVKHKEEQKSANFKYIRTVLTEGNEQGIETFLNVAIGERSYVAESRVTNLEYKTSYVYCEEKKQCANAEFHSKLNIQKQGAVQHLVNVIFDLRKLGIAPEFGLEVNSEMSENKLPQYSLDLHVNKEDKKYHLQVYSKPVYGRFPAGITVTLPQRVLALEALVAYPTDKALPFPIKGELSLYPDKNKPSSKSGARFLVDVTGDEKNYAALGEVGFSHPKLGKEALVKVKANVVIPEKNSFKYESSASVSHPTLGGNRESKVFLEVNPTKVKLYIETPLVKVIDVEGSATVKENLQEGSLRFSLLEGKPVSVYAVVKDFQYYEFTTDESDRKLSIVGHLEPEKRVDISADLILGGDKKNIVHGALFLQDNLVKSDYGFTNENFKYFVNALKKDLDTLEGRIKQLGEKANKDFKATIDRVKPTLDQLSAAYEEDIKKLSSEIANDKALKEISEFLNHIVAYLTKIIDDIVHVTAPVFENINRAAIETSEKIKELYTKQIEPQVRQLYGTLATLLKEFFDGLLDIVTHFAAIVIDFFEKHKAELQELTNTIAEIFKDLTRLVVAQLKELRTKSTAFFENLAKQIKDLPIFESLKEKFQELAVADVLLNFANQLHGLIQSLLPTPEAKEFSTAVFNYLEKKRLHEKIDENAELRILYQKFTKALTSFVQFVRVQLGQYGVPNIASVNPFNYFSGPTTPGTPSFGGNPPAFSVINQLINGDIDDPQRVISEYRVRSLNPFDQYPALLRAVIVDGQHIFTFDGRHLTFPGTCRYVLAHDYVDRNFTLVMQLANGAPKSLVLVDKTGKSIELKENGQVAVDGQAHGFPVIGDDTYAYKEPSGRIGLGSKYGVRAICSGKLEVCYFEVSGYYLGKLRGLLGDGNNEPFDDFRLPNGKVATSESEFGNAYRLASSCPQVKTPEHSHHQLHGAFPPACEQVFGGTSPLKPLSLLLDVSPFKQACAHAATGEEALPSACRLARGYTALAYTGLLPAVVPAACLECTDADKPRSIGDTYELKLPNKQADIIVTVETTVSNEKNFKNVVVPLVSQLIDNLKSKKITDIKVYLVGVTPKFPYPIVYDTDLKLKNAKVVFDDQTRYQVTPVVKTGFKEADKVIEVATHLVDTLRIQLGLTNVVEGYKSVFELPLRPGAVKHTINVVGEKCVNQLFLVEALRTVVYSVLFDEIAYTHSLIAVTNDLKIGGGKNAAQVVGFTEHNVLLLGDKKLGKGTETLRSTLETPSDSCIDFVESTGGFVFSASNFHALAAGEQAQFLQTAAGAIAQRVLGESLLQECACAYADPFRAHSVCVNKQRKEVASRRK